MIKNSKPKVSASSWKFVHGQQHLQVQVSGVHKTTQEHEVFVFSFCRYYNVFKDLSVVAILHSRSGFYIKLWRMLYISIPRIKYIICLGSGIAKKTGSQSLAAVRGLLNTCNA